jgi:hypothetical protein
VRQAHEVSAASTLLNNASTDGVVSVQRRALSMLNAAAFLNPGTDVTVLRAQAAENERDYARAKRLLDQAAVAEPDNLAVWVAYLKLGLLDPSVGNRQLVFGRLHNLDPVAVYTRHSR